MVSLTEGAVRRGRRFHPAPPSAFWAAASLAACWRWRRRALGFRCHIFCPDAESPAFDVSAEQTVAGYDDVAALEDFARAVDVVTYEFENVDVAAVERIGAIVPVRPGRRRSPSARTG